jgi:DNA-binding protein H-NS
MEPDEMTYYHLKEIKMADKIMSQMRRMKNKKSERDGHGKTWRGNF